MYLFEKKGLFKDFYSRTPLLQQPGIRDTKVTSKAVQPLLLLGR